MKKQLPTDIANELAGSSVFFESSARSESPPDPTRDDTINSEESRVRNTMMPRHHDTVVPGNGDDTMPVNPGIGLTTDNAKSTAAMLETIRQAVRRIGKEAATHRFTTQEKMTLADIVYTYSRLGYKTSENEITRIAVNWLILDYHKQGEHSVLARMLESLHR